MIRIKNKALLQVLAMLVTSIFLLGCPIDDDDIFSGDVTVVNNTGANFEHVSIEETGSATGSNLGGINSGGSATFSGYDCATSYTNTVRPVGGVNNISASFTPPCGGTQTVEWN